MAPGLTELTTEGLVEYDWITDWNAPGVVGFTQQFEDVLSGIDRIVYATETVDPERTLRFPPVTSRAVLDTAEYAETFPHLLARIKTLDESDAPAYLKGIADGTPEDELLETSDVAVAPATCMALYPLLTESGVEPGSLYYVTGNCFRAEASTEIGRFRSFRMHEFVFFGSLEDCAAWRDRRVEIAIDLLGELGMTAEHEMATDPFFRPLQRVMGPIQIEQQIKVELVVPIGADRQIAVASGNLHKDYICDRFQVHGGHDEISSSTCAAFGMERIVLAMIAHHGLSYENWPRSVVETLSR